MMLSKSKLLSKVKDHLVKKTIVQQTYIKKDELEIVIELKKFLHINKVEAILTNNGEEISLPYQREKNQLTITVPLTSFNETRATIKLFINGQKMWLTTPDSYDKVVNSYIINNQYYYIKVDKNITFHSLFSEYRFSQEPIIISSLSADYDYLELTFTGDIPHHNNIGILATKNKKIRHIDCECPDQSNKLKLIDFKNLALGQWRIFLTLDDTLYTLNLKSEMQTTFDTLNHEVEVNRMNDELHMHFSNHYLPADSIVVDKQGEQFQLEFEVDLPKEKHVYSLIVEDIKLKHQRFYSLEQHAGNLSASLPISDLVEDFSNQRFFIRSEDLEKNRSIHYQFHLETPSALDAKDLKEVENMAQRIPVKFYRRKDLSLGVTVKKPKLRKMITEIEDFCFSGFLDGLDRFVDCDYYLVLEDRNTEDQISYPIDEEFEISISTEDLIKVKGKEKTVIDLFVVVKDRFDNEIRKEKIKYQLADYKKDNYYDYKLKQDEQNNSHHFLVTTTPFSNLKIETFMIPSDVTIPTNTEVKDPNVWLLGERYNTAQDNGFALFKWLLHNTSIDAYYVIEEDAEDYAVLEDKTNVLTFGSKEHFEIATKAKVLLGTHDLENLLPYKPAKGFFGYEHTLKVFLQHGVLGRKRVEYHRKYYEQPFDLFIVSSYPEKYDVVVDELGYNEEEVAVTGLARFDNLPKEYQPKDILLMPTWRDWINTDEQFLSSQYYNYYSSLINNEELQGLLEKYDVNLNFYPHYRAQDFFAKDLDNDNTRIKFIPLGSKPVQQLLIDHALLITDFSSVSFDFTLMNKPVIFYHFDVKRFFKRGILRPVEETFLGEIATNEVEVIEAIQDRIEHHFTNYDIDTSNIIEYQDNHNSERIYNAVRDKL